MGQVLKQESAIEIEDDQLTLSPNAQKQNIYTPLSHLNKFIKDWVIKVRLLRKFPKRSYFSKRRQKQGQIMNMEFVDRFGTKIQATMFNAVIDQVGNLLKQGRVYKISKGIVELSNPKFIIIKHEFCLTLDENSRIIEVDEDDPAIMSV